jgi:prepilin signal peptidase PulO-like enzyme (type II secretory pathway)
MYTKSMRTSVPLLLGILWSSIVCVIGISLNDGSKYAAIRAFTLTYVGVILIFAAVIDQATMRLPHVLTLSAAVVAVVGTGIVGSASGNADLAIALYGACAGWGIVMVTQIIARLMGGMVGTGDAMLMLSIGALIGPSAAVGVFCTSVLLLRFINCKQRAVPLGPSIVLVALPVILLRLFVHDPYVIVYRYLTSIFLI